MDWSGVDYRDVFISCLDSYSDGTHSLAEAPIDETLMQCYISPFLCFDEVTKLIYISNGQRMSNISASFQFWVNYSFKCVFE